MELHNQFSVPVPVEQAWETLLDLERIAPCLPGASVESFDGEVCRGQVKVKVGPIQLTYRGELIILERDEEGRRLVMSGQGKETRGTSMASARVTAALVEADGVTTVDVHTDLDLTGKPAQFGRGIIADVSNRLIGRFAEDLATMISAPQVEEVAEVAPPGGTTSTQSTAAPAAAKSPAPEAEALDAFSLLPTEVRQGAKIGAVGVLIFALGWLLGARRA